MMMRVGEEGRREARRSPLGLEIEGIYLSHESHTLVMATNIRFVINELLEFY